MGWLVDLAKVKRMDSARSIAHRMWTAHSKDWPKRGPKWESLANNLAKLDRWDDLDWWLGDKGAPYRPLLARVLGLEVDALLARLEERRPTGEDPDRWFEFEVFPRLRAIDLDEEEPFPGIPPRLMDGNGLVGRVWWHAPAGAGRTLVGRWLSRRYGWHLFWEGPRPPERSFIELAAGEPPPSGLPRTALMACPTRPTPAMGSWETLHTPSEWTDTLVAWVEARLEEGGRYDADAVARWLAVEANRAAMETPGQLIELLALVDQVGPGALDAGIGAGEQLRAWVRVHAARPSRDVRPASRTFLVEHGAWTLVQVETARRARGLPTVGEVLLALFPAQPPPLAPDTILEILRRDGEPALEAALRPPPEALVAAMVALRWLLPTGWGFPSRVEALLLDEVAREGALRDHETLAGLLGDPALTERLVVRLAEPELWSRQLRDLATRDLEDPDALTVLNALLRALALATSHGHRPSLDDLNLQWRLLARALQDAPQGWALPLPAVGLPPGAGWIAWDGVWFLATLTLTRSLAAECQPSGPPWCTWTAPQTDLDRRALEAGVACLDMLCTSTPPPELAALRRLAVQTLWALGARFSALQSSSSRILGVMRALDAPPDGSGSVDSANFFALDLIAAVAEVLGQPFETVVLRLWPLWLAKLGAPWMERPSTLLQRTWDLAPPEGWRQAHVRQTLQQAARGVRVPDCVWMQILPLADSFEAPGAADLAPAEVLLSCVTLSGGGEEREVLTREAWRRCPESLLAWLDAQLQVDPEHAAVARMLEPAPEGAHRPIIDTLQQRLGARRRALPPGIDTWLLSRVRRRDAGWEDAWRLWLMCNRTRPTHCAQGEPAAK